MDGALLDIVITKTMIWFLMNVLGPSSVEGMIRVGLVGNTLCVLIT